MSGTVQSVRQGGVAWVTLGHPGKFNAMSRGMWRELRAVFTALQVAATGLCVYLELERSLVDRPYGGRTPGDEDGWKGSSAISRDAMLAWSFQQASTVGDGPLPTEASLPASGATGNLPSFAVAAHGRGAPGAFGLHGLAIATARRRIAWSLGKAAEARCWSYGPAWLLVVWS